MAMLDWEDFVTKDGLFKPVRAGALAPISGRYLLRVREGSAEVWA